MSKAVLVINMPENCLVCPLKYNSEDIPLGNYTYQKLFRCRYEPEDISEDDGDVVYLNDIMMKSKPNWCPLRELPQKITSWKGKSTNYQQGHRDGYNACIDEILKGSVKE